MPYRPYCALVLLGAALAAPAGRTHAASKIRIAAIGDAAPGGGVFAGPGFSGWPAAAGSGWIAFRGEVTGGSSSETMVVAHMTAPTTRAQVASIGQTTPSGGPYVKCAGTLKQFVGHPVVNASGDVAFVALVEPPENVEPDESEVGPTPAGIFLLRAGELRPVACSGQATGGGILDLTAVLDLFSDDDTGDIADRAPALNDAGDVAFLTGYVTEQGFPNGGAVLVASGNGNFTELSRIDGPFDGGKFVTFGPPALNNRGVIAFHAVATTSDPSDGDGLIDGIFASEGGALRVVVRDGIAPMPADQTLFEFRDEVSLNDDGDVAFLAGPLFDFSDNANLDDLGGPGVLVCRAGVTSLIGYPGQLIGPDRVSSVRLGAVAGSEVAGPSIGPDGRVVFFVTLNGGNAEAVVLWNGLNVLPLVYSGGNGADESPTGGLYAGAASAPALDASGGVVFLARIVGGSSSEAIIYRSGSGAQTPIVLGEAAPLQNEGFFGGRPFATPHLNDRGDVVFRAFVTRGSSSVGVFRARDGELTAVVRAGDPSPSPGAPAFVDLVGEPSVNHAGDVAFAAQIPLKGRGIFVASATGLRQVVLRNDAAPGPPGTKFIALGPNPQINDAGGVAFRATTQLRDPLTGLTLKQEGIFLSDGAGLRALVYAHEASPSGLPFLKLRDPFLTDVPSVVFRAPLGNSEEESNGLFIADALGATEVAVERQSLGGDIVLTSFSGNPSVTGSGEVAFLATRAMPLEAGGPPIRGLGQAILKRSAAGLELVVARDMPGPTGGIFRTLGPPAINTAGHVIFRASFQPLSGGTSGLFLAQDGALAPYLLRGEVTPLGGRFSAFGTRPSLNSHDEIAFLGSIAGGKARSAIFMASPARLVARRVALLLTEGQGRDRVTLRLRLEPGRVSDGVRPAREPIVLALNDTAGTLWSATVPARQVAKRGRLFTITPARSSDLGRLLRSLKLSVARNGSVRVAAVTPPFDLTRGGLRELKPPFTISLGVGDDSGMTSVTCTPGRRRTRCR